MPSAATLAEFVAIGTQRDGGEKVAIAAAPLASGFHWHEPADEGVSRSSFVTETELFASTPQARRRRKQEQVTRASMR